MTAATEHPTARFQQPVDAKALYMIGLSDVIKPPMDVGTVVNRLKRGLYGSVRDLLLDVELFMANATRSFSPPAAVEGCDYFQWISSRCLNSPIKSW
jgi:hypothetical protein